MSDNNTGRIVKVSGPLVIAEGMQAADMFDVVRVSREGLIGEVLEMRGDRASIQVYEETAGLGPGEPVVTTGVPLSVELGPGLISRIFDGIQRPLERIREQHGANIPRGIQVDNLDREKTWDFEPTVSAGDEVSAGDIMGTVQETALVEHRIMAPVGVSGTVEEVLAGPHTVTDVVARIRRDNGDVTDVTMLQRWPVRQARPYKEKITPRNPLITGSRSIDTFFPVARGGTAAIPGPFGSGKTVVQHQLAKWSDVDIVIYIGCGERGNEMTDVLTEFPELLDPKSGESLMQRTVLIANTSDMPVAAREASIYTGITIAEYFRDMGYSIAVIADSTSRWAEALREMSGRLEEMPGEEGYPAYLGSRLAQFYERAGYVKCLGSQDREGSLTAIGAVSPPGGDLSDPVAQATLRIVKVFWGLDSTLAYRRHYPAINWLNSYSLYEDRMDTWMNANVSPRWQEMREQAMRLLQQEAELEEIVRLVGLDALSPGDRLVLEAARSIREDYLQQDSFDEVDTYSSLEKKVGMLESVLMFYNLGLEALERGISIQEISDLPVRARVAQLKYVPEDELEPALERVRQAYREQFDNSGAQTAKTAQGVS